MAVTKTYARICLDTINNYTTEAEQADRATDRDYWLRQAKAARNELKRKNRNRKVSG